MRDQEESGMDFTFQAKERIKKAQSIYLNPDYTC